MGNRVRPASDLVWICRGNSWSSVLLVLLLVLFLSNESALCQESYFPSYPSWSSAGERTNSIAVGDVDGDGDLDLIFGGTGGGSALHLNTGGEIETSAAWYSDPIQASQTVALGDVDGDGDLDLVCGNYGERNTLYLNTGGTFVTSPSWSSGWKANTESVALGDVDGDGDLDLVCGNSGYYSALYLNTGGTFETSSPTWSSEQYRDTRSVALGDVDGDGDLDLVCGNANQSNALYTNIGGTFDATPSWSSGPIGNTRSIALGDVDGDGDLDLVCGNYGQSNTVYLNTGGTFESSTSWSVAQLEQTQSITLGDVDADGDLDLVCGNYNQNTTLYLNADSTFQDSPAWTSAATYDDTRSVVLGDVDGDGYLDLVCGKSGSHLAGEKNTLYLNVAGPFEMSPTTSLGTGAASVAFGDVDGNGQVDLVFGSYNEANTLYLSTDGAFDTSPSWSSGPTWSTSSVALGDVDGDGDLDLVCGNVAQSNTLYRNTGGTFGTSPSWSSGPTWSTSSVALGDVDGDGDLDLVCGNSGMGDENNTLYLNTGGTFETYPSWSSGVSADTRGIVLGDVDGDGDLDLVCGNYAYGGFSNENNDLYLNTGGTFETLPSWTSDYHEFTYSIALGDVDGDGDLDLVCGSGGESITLYENAGGTFDATPSWSSQTHEIAWSMALGDVDGDGDLDLVCGGTSIYVNTGGTLETSPSWSLEPTGTTMGIAVGDVDGDGDLDIVCTIDSAPGAIYAGRATPAFAGDLLSPRNHLPNNGAHVRFVVTEQANPPEYHRIDFTARDVESDPIWLVADYQYEGDPAWHPVLVGGHIGKVGPFSTSPAGVQDSIQWDTRFLPFDQRDVVLRLRVMETPNRTGTIQHAASYLKEMGPVTPYRPVISTAAPLVFPTVTLGDTTSAGLTVANEGSAVLTIAGVELPTTDMHVENTLPVVVAPNESVEVTIQLSPSSAVDIQGDLVVHSNDPIAPYAHVELVAGVRPLDFTLVSLYPTGETQQGAPLNISVVMQDYVHVDSARVFFREGGKKAFDVMDLQRIDDPVNEQYYGSVPAGSVGARGVEYFVEVYNDRFSREESLQRLRTRVKSMDFGVEPPPESYALLSIPLEMEGPIFGVLSDDLGGLDNTSWRMYGYDNMTAAYVQLPNDTITEFEVGRGYWLIRRGNHRLDTGPAEGLSIPTDRPFEIALQPGWSILGDPFAFPVAWDTIAVDSLSMAEAEEQGVIEPPWRWVPSAGQYRRDVTVLEPFQAYWVLNSTDPPREIVLRVPPVEANVGAALASAGSARGAGDGGAWNVMIGVRCGNVAADHNHIGIRSRASETYDPFDRSAPPINPGRGMSLYFPHTEWERHAGRYAVDIRGSAGDRGVSASASTPGSAEGVWGHAWRFDVAKNFSDGAAGDEIVLEFSGIESLPEDLEIVLVDRKLERVVELREERTYSFFQGQRAYVSQEEARFELLVGSDAFVDSYGDGLPALPTETALHQNHPNPFNPSTVIRYELATAGRVRLEIYDVSGALVKVLEDRYREPGRYEVGWDGTTDRNGRVASGVYFYVLEAPGTRVAKKMLCVK